MNGCWSSSRARPSGRSADGLDRRRRHADPGAAVFRHAEEAIAYAERAGIPYDVEIPHARKIKPKAYADNFSYGRMENWTH